MASGHLGEIHVDSTLGHPSRTVIPTPEPPAPETGVILLVEDQSDVRALVRDVLSERGYRLLIADGPVAALQLARETTDVIDLLVTDIVMPAMNGLALAERLLVDRPEMKVLYMTGYSHDIVMAHGTPQAGSLIEKPFTPRQLAVRVREVLG